MHHRTLKFEHVDARGWQFQFLDDHDVVLLVSIKYYDSLGEAVDDIRDLIRFVEEM